MPDVTFAIVDGDGHSVPIDARELRHVLTQYRSVLDDRRAVLDDRQAMLDAERRWLEGSQRRLERERARLLAGFKPADPGVLPGVVVELPTNPERNV
jgi:hypothetical protein